MGSKKPDAAAIVAKIDELAGASWLGRAGAVWPNNLYHFADVRNAAKILINRKLYCRNRIQELGLLEVDSADQEVIAQSGWAHQYARLYFAPRTPTQYHMEGIKPLDQRHNGAHCPVPIFFIFDSRSLLSRAECQFSGGNLATFGHTIGSDSKDFANLPFRDIYHRGALPSDRKPEITRARNAEVLFKGELDLEHLKAVVCRTGPERETLLNLLGRVEAKNWKDSIRLPLTDEGLFESRWFFVKEITLIDRSIYVQMSRPCSTHPQVLEINRANDPETYRLKPRVPDPRAAQVIYDLPWQADMVRARLTVIDSLAYQGMLTQRSLF